MFKIEKLIFANDHGGVEMKQELINYFSKRYEVINCGTDTFESVDYPDYAQKLVLEYRKSPKNSLGIAICGTGIGIGISLNKFHGIRCANLTSIDFAKLAREHNNCNMISLSGRFLTVKENIAIIESFLSGTYETRHQNRIDKISQIEKNNNAKS